MTDEREDPGRSSGLTRRTLFKTAGMAAATSALAGAAEALAQEAAAGATATGPGAVPVALRLNGKTVKVEVEPRRTLLDAIRGDAQLIGAKRACDRGSCGACTVWMDGLPIYACTVLAIEAEGHDIRTIEGLGTPEKPHPVQQEFMRHDALQCGFCTPGLVMSTAWAVETYGKELTDEQLREATAGNLCRCGTYAHVLQAGHAAAQRKGG